MSYNFKKIRPKFYKSLTNNINPNKYLACNNNNGSFDYIGENNNNRFNNNHCPSGPTSQVKTCGRFEGKCDRNAAIINKCRPMCGISPIEIYREIIIPQEEIIPRVQEFQKFASEPQIPVNVMPEDVADENANRISNNILDNIPQQAPIEMERVTTRISRCIPRKVKYYKNCGEDNMDSDSSCSGVSSDSSYERKKKDKKNLKRYGESKYYHNDLSNASDDSISEVFSDSHGEHSFEAGDVCSFGHGSFSSSSSSQDSKTNKKRDPVDKCIKRFGNKGHEWYNKVNTKCEEKNKYGNHSVVVASDLIQQAIGVNIFTDVKFNLLEFVNDQHWNYDNYGNFRAIRPGRYRIEYVLHFANPTNTIGVVRSRVMRFSRDQNRYIEAENSFASGNVDKITNLARSFIIDMYPNESLKVQFMVDKLAIKLTPFDGISAQISIEKV